MPVYKRILPTVFLLPILLLAPACNTNKRLQTHRREIHRLAHENLTPEARLDGLATTLVKVLDESLQYVDPRESYGYVESFYQQNQKDLENLYGELNTWINGMSTLEKLALGGRVAIQPYTSDLITLVPRFRRKVENQYKTWQFLNKSLGLFKLENMVE